MRKTLLLRSEGSRLRKLEIVAVALGNGDIGAEAFVPRAESFLMSVHRTTVAATDSMRSCKENPSLTGDRFGQCNAGER